ncbi:MAG: hypothetical protein Q9164_007355 [Protoblastenia rupestris]
MSTDLGVPLSSQPSTYKRGQSSLNLPSSEKKRKRTSQARDISPTKRRRHEATKSTIQAAAPMVDDEQEPDKESVTRKTLKKSKKNRLQGESGSLEPSVAAKSSAKTHSGSQSVSSPFRLRKSSLYLPIFPIYGTYPAQGLCADHLSPLLLSYYPPLKGVLLSYSNVKLSCEGHSGFSNPSPDHNNDSDATQAYANIIESYGPYYTHLTADFLLFAPQKDDLMEGHRKYRAKAVTEVLDVGWAERREAWEKEATERCNG